MTETLTKLNREHIKNLLGYITLDKLDYYNAVLRLHQEVAPLSSSLIFGAFYIYETTNDHIENLNDFIRYLKNNELFDEEDE